MNKEESGVAAPINKCYSIGCAENVIKCFYAGDIVEHIGAIV